VNPGDVISERYRLLRLLDVGGMGEVWAARNELTQKNFAIKFLLPELAEQPESLERFIREAETAGGLNHPAIVDVFDVAQAEDGRPFIVMELLGGESLEARVERAGAMTPLDAASVIAQVADGLHAAHRAGVVHRDLSSSNVFLVRNPEGGRPNAKILDFGVSKTLGPSARDRMQTAHGAVLGCPEFMSPEQARGAETVDARTDVWSLGVVLYQCLTGATPFRANNYNALMVSILTRPHRPLLEVASAVDPELASLVEACLVKDRERRVSTAREVSDRLAAIARRIAGPSGGEASPRRRATDRLPRSLSDGAARHGATGGNDASSVARLRSRTKIVGVASGVFGIGVGVLFAFLTPLVGPLVGRGVRVTAPVKVMVPPAPSANNHGRSTDELVEHAIAAARRGGTESKIAGQH
jgi:eukaryotic-like serine/threonine-protein kinase